VAFVGAARERFVGVEDGVEGLEEVGAAGLAGGELVLRGYRKV
jgi:hypothetical protein